MKEVVAVERLMLPGVLAIQGHQHHGAGPVRLLPREALEFANEVPDRIIAVPSGIGEADQVGQLIMTEEQAEVLAGHAPGVQLGGGEAALAGRLDRISEDTAAAGRPAEATLLDQLQCAGADRALRRPAACRRAPEGTLEHARRLLQVPDGARFATR